MTIKNRFWIVFVALLPIGSWATEIFIYNTTLAKPASIEKELSEIIKEADVKVFARFIDFKAMVEKSNPAIVIAPHLTLKSLKLENNIKATGVLEGNTDQPYILVSLNAQIDLSKNPNAKIGVLDIAGRKEMKDLIARIIGPLAKYKSVTKLEDLIPMLTFKSADAILITPSDLALLKSRTKANLFIKELSNKRSENSSIALNPLPLNVSEVKKIYEVIIHLNSKELKALGVQSWK